MGGSPEVRSWRPIWLTWQNLVSTKNTKISWAWWRAPVLRRLRQENRLNPGDEVAVSWDGAIALQPGKQEGNSIWGGRAGRKPDSKLVLLSRYKLLMARWKTRPGTVAHVCHPSTSGGWGRSTAWGQEFKTSLQNKKAKKNYLGMVAYTCSLSYPRGLLEPRSLRVRWAMIVPLYSSLGDPSVKKFF